WPLAGAATVTFALADFVESASLVAVTVSVPVLLGATYTPPALIVPDAADQVTDLSDTEPFTVAANCSVPPTVTDVLVGVMVTELTAGVDTVTVAVPDFVASAALVAVIVTVAAVAGAVNFPVVSMVPADAFQVTDLSVTVPVTAAVNCCVALVSSDADAG